MRKVLIIIFTSFVCSVFINYNSIFEAEVITQFKKVSVMNDAYNNDNPHEKINLDMNLRYPESISKISLTYVKTLSDMNENFYTLCEFYPSGYSIYTRNFETILEISDKANSPYLNYFDNLVYLGAFNYFIKETSGVGRNFRESISHTMQNYRLVLNSETRNDLNSMASSLKKESEKQILDNSLRSRSNNFEQVSISSPSIIKNANTTGFNTSNTTNCSYVAAALLVFYASRNWGWTNLYNQTIIKNSLVQEIQKGRPGPANVGDVEDALNNFMNSKGSTHKAKINMWWSTSPHAYYDRVSENKPVILTGSLPSGGSNFENKPAHAVVVYKVSREYKVHIFGIREYINYIYTVHWGWDTDRNDVQLSDASINRSGLLNLHRP